jgi:AcrR family transcriptional regulator
MARVRPADSGAEAGGRTGGTSAADDGTTARTPAAVAELPGSVAAAWGVRERPHKGPKPALNLARIVEAAVRVADAEGLDAVSMGRVAAELGAAPMSLYRHLSGKEELLELMTDAAWGDPPATPAADEEWRTGLTRWTWAMRANARRHSWVARIALNSLPIMPHQVAWFENALACMAGTGLTEARKGSVIMLLAGYVRNIVATEVEIGAAVVASGLDMSAWMASYSGMLRRLADPQRFPALRKFVEAGVFDVADGPDDEFIFGLDRILDGIAALISTSKSLSWVVTTLLGAVLTHNHVVVERWGQVVLVGWGRSDLRN